MTVLPPYDERELLLRVAEGDEDAFTRIFEVYAKMLLPFLIKLTRVEAIAEELLQEAMLRVWIHRTKLPKIRQPRSWVFRIAANLAYSWLRKKVIEEKIVAGFREESETITAEDELSLKDLQEKIKEAINLLPPRRREIYQLSRTMGLSPEEISKKLNVSRSTVKNTLGEALKSIRDYLEKAGYTAIIILLFLIKK